MRKEVTRVRVEHHFNEPENSDSETEREGARATRLEVELRRQSAPEMIADIIRQVKVRPAPADASEVEAEKFNSFSEHAGRFSHESLNTRNERFLARLDEEVRGQVAQNFDALQTLAVNAKLEPGKALRTSQNEKSVRADIKRHFELLRDYILNGAVLDEKT